MHAEYVLYSALVFDLSYYLAVGALSLASSPGHSHVFNVATLKTWEWPGDEARLSAPTAK